MTTPRTRSPDPFQAPARPAHLSGEYRFGRIEVPTLDADDEPTQPGGPQGLEYQAGVVRRAFLRGSPEFRAWLMRVCDFEAWGREPIEK